MKKIAKDRKVIPDPIDDRKKEKERKERAEWKLAIYEKEEEMMGLY